MPKATWNGVVIADSENCQIVEGNYYFPPESVNSEHLETSNTHTTCSWKGQASYYTINVQGQKNQDAAWFYPDPKEKAANIKNYIAFWKGVKVE